jgi:hypothetical protein
MGKPSGQDLSGYFSLPGACGESADKGKTDEENWKGLWEELRRRCLVCSTCNSKTTRMLIFHQEM